MRGEILLQLARAKEGWAALDLALEIARSQKARMEELRVAMAMLRLGDKTHQPARIEILRQIYMAFEDGEHLPDLRFAREQLAAHDTALLTDGISLGRSN